MIQHQPSGNNNNSSNNNNTNRHLMQHLCRACLVKLLSSTVENALLMWHLELPGMKAEVVVVALLGLLEQMMGQKRLFVHNSVCSQFLEGLFAILAECSQFCLRSFQLKFKRKSITLLVGRGGGLRGAKIMNKNIVNKLAFPNGGSLFYLQLDFCLAVELLFLQSIINCGPRGGTGGAKPAQGSRGFGGPSGASDFDPSFQQFVNGAPSTVRNFMNSSGCSVGGPLPKEERVPTVLGVAQF